MSEFESSSKSAPRRRGLWLTVFLDLLLLTILSVCVDAFVVWRIYEDELLDQRTGVAGVLASGLRGALESMPADVAQDPDALRAQIDGLLKPFETRDLGLESAVLYDEKGKEVFHVGAAPGALSADDDLDLISALAYRQEVFAWAPGKSGPFFNSILEITAPVDLQNGAKWAIRVTMPLQEGEGVFSRLQKALLALFVANAILLSIMGHVLINRRLVSPLAKLVAALRDVGGGKLDSQVPIVRDDEIGELAQSFNEMVVALASARVKLEEQVKSLAEANAQIQSAQDQLILSEKLASVGRLAAGIAHEIGNPLAAVVGYVELLVLDAKDDLTRDTLGRVQKEVHRIDGIVREMLDMARPAVETAQWVDLPHLIEDLLAFLKMQPRMGAMETQILAAPDLPGIWVQEQRLRQALMNLILNAADAQEGEGHIRIHLEALTLDPQFMDTVEAGRPHFLPLSIPSTGSFVGIHVEDEGEGIGATELRHIFEPFFTTKDPGKGTGLGMPVTLSLVERQGGFMVVKSAPNAGTRVSIYLPSEQEAAL